MPPLHRPQVAATTKYQLWQAFWPLLIVDNHPCQCCEQTAISFTAQNLQGQQKTLKYNYNVPSVYNVPLKDACQLVGLKIGALKNLDLVEHNWETVNQQ